MNNGVNEKKGAEITVSSLFEVFKKFFWLIVAAMLLFASALGAYSAFLVETRYTASAKYTVVNILSNNEYIADTMINAASDIAGIFVEIADENIAVSAAVEAGKLDEYFGCSKAEAVKKVSAMISASKESDESPIFTVTATSGNKNDVYMVITAFQQIVPSVVTELNRITIDDKVSTTAKPVSVITLTEQVSEINPSVVRNTVMGAMVGFVISYLIAFVIFVCDTKVYDESTIKRYFDHPVLGTIPSWGDVKNKKKRGFLIFGKNVKKINTVRDYSEKILSNKTPFAVSEAFNSLRTNICYLTSDSRCPVYAITSDFSGVGKSVLSVNVALSFAMLGKKTLLVECDLRRPKASKIMDMDVKAGLSELLSGVVANREDVIKCYKDTGLDVVFAGHIPPNPSLLLGSESMKQFLESSKEIYDVIILDTPPVFEVSDACVVAPLADGVVVVARSEYSDINAIRDSLDLIEGVDGRIAGFVVNDVDVEFVSRYISKYGKSGNYKKYSMYSKGVN